MATIKSYTDIEQSKKLAEILPIESADMWWSRCTITDFGDGELKVSYAVEPCNISQFRNTKEDIPCWSLAALLSVLPDSIYDNTNEFSQLEFSKRSVAYHDMNDGIKVGSIQDNLVDACYKLILKLHELNLL